MEYRNGISRLGFGCMRLPHDRNKSEELILTALDEGINYFDTAYIYTGNEEMLGRIITARRCRGKMNIASKVPHYLLKRPQDLDRIFNTTLSRLQTDYIDFYLMHMLPDVKTWERLRELGIEQWLADKKAAGQIRRIGFSYHGGSRNFIELLDVYDWEFAQVQYNYVDVNSQAGRAGVEAAAERGIPIFIMEPLRGGLLVDRLPQQAKDMIAAAEPQRSAAEWGLRWLWSQEPVHMVLSGMTSVPMIRENARIAGETPVDSLTPADERFYEQLSDCIRDNLKIGCTGCAYCMPCPFGVNIPGCFRCYNASYADGWWRGLKEYFMVTAFARRPAYASLCQACGRCVQRCPQSIPIPELLPQVKKRLEIPGFKAARWFIRRRMLRDRDD
ncbi:MAG: aldo/keto reductase [Anaerovoracaceae bacterium]|jgi:predicted aldo/keto reductase-like oxidoreductase